jgi:hypothetical protein
MPYVPSEKTVPPAFDRVEIEPKVKLLADTIAATAAKYKYDGAFAGELNYALTRLLQHLPRSLMQYCGFKEEIRYWIQPLMYGVLFDVAFEHKRRVNIPYESAQIEKSGDCYDTPFYTRLVNVVDESGKKIGTMEVQLKRSEETLNKDILDGDLVLSRKSVEAK